MKKVTFISNGSFFKAGEYQMPEKDSVMMTEKGYGAVKGTKEADAAEKAVAAKSKKKAAAATKAE